MIIVTVKPAGNPDGRKAYSGRGQLWDAFVASVAAGERLIVRRSTTPFLDAARVLAEEGVDRATPVAMRHEGKAEDALRSAVGKAAGLTVRDGRTGKPIFVKWKPNSFRTQSSAGSSPMRQNEEEAVGVAAGQKNAPASRQRHSYDNSTPAD
jgi:hypothetical protein